MANNGLHSNTQVLHGTSIERSSKVPIYHQLYVILRDRILHGEWQAGDLLPAEPELMEFYDVSRITVRQAVELLANENLVYKRRGKGTFVSLAKVRTDAARLISFEEDMQERGLKPSIKVIEADIVQVSRVTAEKLNMKNGDDLAFLSRLCLADNEPILLDQIFLVHDYCKGFLDGHDYAVESPYDVLEQEYDIRIERAEQNISAMNASKSWSDILEVSEQQALIYIERYSYSQLNIPVEYRRMYYRADRYALQLALKR